MKKIRNLLAVFLFLGCFLSGVASVSVCAEDYITVSGSSSMEQATAVQLNQSYVTSINERNHEYWFRFTTLPGDNYYYLETVNIDVYTHSWANVFKASLCDSAKNVIVENPHITDDKPQLSQCKLDPNTTYWLRINNAYNGNEPVTPGNFKFRILTKADSEKDTREEATKVPLNQKISGTLDADMDEDWFTFTTGTGREYTFYGYNIDVKTQGWEGGINFRFILTNEWREEICTMILIEGKNKTQELTLEPNSTYYICAIDRCDENTYSPEVNHYLFSVSEAKDPVKETISDDAVTITPTDYTYDGSMKQPSVTVTVGGKTLTEDTDYTVAYSSNINAGKASVTVTGTGDYTGTVTKQFTIQKAEQKITGTTSYSKMFGNKPFKLNISASAPGKLKFASSNKKVVSVDSNGKVTIKGCGTASITVKTAKNVNYKASSLKIKVVVKPKANRLTAKAAGFSSVILSWKKIPKVTGYQISYSTNSAFLDAKNKNISKAKTSLVLTKLSKWQKYYFRVRGYAKSGKSIVYSEWSGTKEVLIR